LTHTQNQIAVEEDSDFSDMINEIIKVRNEHGVLLLLMVKLLLLKNLLLKKLEEEESEMKMKMK
jgi:hypothetical protein